MIPFVFSIHTEDLSRNPCPILFSNSGLFSFKQSPAVKKQPDNRCEQCANWIIYSKLYNEDAQNLHN